MWKTNLYVVVLLLLGYTTSMAQITPPGLGENENANLWVAIGFQKKLDSPGRVTSLSYLGIGRESSRADYNILKRQGIIVLNEEIGWKFHKSWKLAQGLSYRRQNEYEERPPYESEEPGYKNEIRLYNKLTHYRKLGMTTLAFTARQECRWFYAPGGHPTNEIFQLRTRVKMQGIIPVSKARTQFVTLGVEPLFSSSRFENKAGMQPLSYHETRFSCFYSFTPLPHMVCSIGYMNDLVHRDIHYLSFDVVFKS